MTDCNSPKCHERVNQELSSKVSKKSMWIALWSVIVVLILPAFLTGVQVWSRQEADDLRYAARYEIEESKRVQAIVIKDIDHIRDDLKSLKQGQIEVQRDLKEVLRFLRDNNGK